MPSRAESVHIANRDPSLSAMAKGKDFWMQNLRHDFRRFDEPRSRAIEEMMTVDQKNASFPDRPQILPCRIFGKQVQVANSLGYLESAGNEKNDFGIGLD